MLNNKYRTVYHTGKDKNMVSALISLICYTKTCYLDWKKCYDNVLNEYYYYAEDDVYKEKYYFYIDSPIIGNVLQIISDKEEMNYEIDDTIYKEELSELSEVIIKANNIKLPVKKNTSENTYRTYNNYNYNYKSYKQTKLEKALKQLNDVIPLRNSEML